MTQSMIGSRQKIGRAGMHIAELKARMSHLADSYTASIEKDPDSGIENIKHCLNDSTILMDVALIVGDIVHNLKCALDYAWLETIEVLAPIAVGGFAKFPVYPTYDDLKGVLRGRKIDTASQELFELIMSKIKPYEGGNDSIWSIHRLDIRDKHRLLIPVINYSSIGGIEVENEHGETVRGGTRGTFLPPPHYIPIESGWSIKNKGKVSVTLVFDEDTPVFGLDVLDMVSCYRLMVLNVVELLEGLLSSPQRA